MADDKLISKPITPSLSEVEASIDPTAALNAPAPVLPPLFNIPDGVPQTLRNNKQLQGNQNTAVVPGSARENNKEFIKALVSSASDPNLVKDRYRYGRAYSFGAGEKALNFERYYNHPKFKQFGFNPYRDNETYYNQRSSWWDDFSRMRGQWLGLVWNGFKSVWGDSRAAHEQMEKAMSIGASTRDGFGGWVTNFGMNSAYTVGIMGELALENLGFLLLETATLGGATPLATGIAGRNAIGFGRLIKTLTGTRDLVKSLKNAGSARDFYNTVYRGGKGVVNVLNPLARTTQFAKDYNKIYKAGDKISDLAFITRGFGGFYKDLREINLAVSEAGIEGEGAASQYQQQLLNEFYAANGRMPDDKEAKQIWDRVHSVRTSVSLANDFVIYGTNKLVFDGLFNGFRSGPGIQKAFLKGSGRTLEKTAAGTYKAGVTPSLQAGARTFKHKAKDFILKSPYLPWTKEYMVGNLSEGIQESSQEIITQAAINYHNKIERDPSQIGFYGVLGSIGSGLSDQFSAQGLDTFLQGYLMGSLIQGGTKTITKPYEWAKGTKKKAFAAATEQDNNILNAANHINANAMVYGKSNINTFSYVKQLNEEREKRRANGDQAGAEALTDEINTAYFHNLARSGNMGLVTEHVDDMLSLSDEELLNAYNLDHEGLTDGAEVRKRLLNLKDKATNYQKRYDKIKKIKPNPFAPWDLDK